MEEDQSLQTEYTREQKKIDGELIIILQSLGVEGGGETKSFEPPPLPQSKSWWLTMTGRKVIIFLMKKQLPSLFYGDFKQRSCVHQYGYTMGMAAALRGEECVSLGRDIQQLLL